MNDIDNDDQTWNYHWLWYSSNINKENDDNESNIIDWNDINNTDKSTIAVSTEGRNNHKKNEMQNEKRRRWKEQPEWNAGLTLVLRQANERRRYKVTPSLIGWVQT